MSLNRMKSRWSLVLALGVAAACIALLPASAAAQAREWDIQGNVGVAVPLGDLADTHDPGAAFGLGLSRWFSDRMAFRLGTGVDLLSGAESDIRDLTLWHYNAGIEGDLIDPAESNVRLHGLVGAGATTTNVEDGDTFNNFSLNGGLSLEYAFSPDLNGLVGTQLHVFFGDDERLPGGETLDGTRFVLPAYVGFRYLFSTE